MDWYTTILLVVLGAMVWVMAPMFAYMIARNVAAGISYGKRRGDQMYDDWLKGERAKVARNN